VVTCSPSPTPPPSCLPASVSNTPPTCTFLTDVTSTVTTAPQPAQSLRTIAKPIARRPANATNPNVGSNGNLHNSALLPIAAANLPSSSGGGLANNTNESAGGGGSSVCNSTALSNTSTSSSTNPGNYSILI